MDITINIKQTTKGKISAEVNSFFYYCKRKNASSTNYVCHQEGCSASVTIDDASQSLLKINGTKVEGYIKEMLKKAHKKEECELSFVLIESDRVMRELKDSVDK